MPIPDLLAGSLDPLVAIATAEQLVRPFAG